MKTTHWKLVMFFAIILMLMGSGMSLWAVHAHNQALAIAGIVVVMIVCASWWFWVMFIIRTMIEINDRTLANVKDIHEGISTVRSILQDYESTRQR
jgi:hypothetical protein